ncbi:MAG: exo-alpha-sialidase [Candidatus Latescibacterota bacterium]
MGKAQPLPEQTRRIVPVLEPKFAAQLQQYRARLSAHAAGYPVLTDWHPVIPPGWGEFPKAPTQRATIYRGNADTWAYSHHQSIAKFGEQYVVAWSNGLRHEDYVGQEVHCASSSDGLVWSDPRVVVHTPVETGLVRNHAGLCASGGRLYCYVGVVRDFGRDVAPPGMYSLKDQRVRLDVYVTEDMRHWEHHENIYENIYLVESPRPLLDGRLMCCGFDLTDMHAIVLIWDDPTHPENPPRAVHIPPGPDGMSPEEGTWYQRDDGRIFMYQRDNAMSCRLGLTVSDDGGDTWSDLLHTDFPNSLLRAFAGRLSDGRYYIAGNNYDILLDRRHLLLALSDEGLLFDRQVTLVEGHTTRRINGRHKEDGFHYPNCLVDGDKLLMVYSVNKEDIEICIVDMSAVQ